MKGVGIRKPKTQAAYEKLQKQMKALKRSYWELKISPSILAERLHDLGFGESKTLEVINSWKAIQRDVRDPKNNRFLGSILLGHLSYSTFNSLKDIQQCVTIGTRAKVKEKKDAGD